MAPPGVFEPDLASALNNLSDDFLALGDAENALAAAQEAVALRTPLARDNPAVFDPLLASALSNTGAALLVRGRLDEAAEYADMAVAAYRAASENRPDAFVGRLAAALGNLANIRLARQDVTGAVSATGEVITLLDGQPASAPLLARMRDLRSALSDPAQSIVDIQPSDGSG